MSMSIDQALLGRYIAGSATPEEQGVVEHWIGTDPVRRAAVAELRAAWAADAEQLQAPYDAEAAWARLSERVDLLTLVRDGDSSRPVRVSPFAQSPHPFTRAARWAAAAAVVALAGAGAWRALAWREAERVATAPAVAPPREYVTPRGQRGIVRLPDGTEVMLNVASRLTVPATFGAPGQAREVRLEGQAHFTVVHDSTARPFTVRTPRGVTRDVGTRFDVRAYEGDTEERVAVTEGEVAVRADSAAAEVPLREGQVAVLTPAGRVALARGANVAREVAWMSGRLELPDVTLAEAARQLGRWYDLDVRVANDDLASRRVVGSYSNEPVTQVLDLVVAAIGARYERSGRTVTIVPGARAQ